MKKNITYLFTLLFLFSCSTNVQSTISVPVDIHAKENLDVGVNVGNKISGEAVGTLLFDKYCLQCPTEFTAGVFGGNYSILKAAATYNAMNQTEADLIINPQYVIKKDWNPIYTTVKVEVTGYVGTIENIEN